MYDSSMRHICPFDVELEDQMNYITLDFAGIGSLQDLHDYFKTALDLPGYYGRNMDALWDCLYLCYDRPTTIVLKNVAELSRHMQGTAEAVLSLFDDLQNQDENVTVVTDQSQNI